MIIQLLLNWWAGTLAQLVLLVPALPPVMADMLVQLQTGSAYLASVVAKFSPIVPFAAISAIVAAYLGALTFWAGMQVLRASLWLLGR